MTDEVKLAIIGGTGLYDVPGMNVLKKVQPVTPWGKPSDEIVISEYDENGNNLRVAFLPRHGQGHFIVPGEIPQKANMAALKMLGVDHIIAFSAVGSLKEEIAPTDFIIPDQIIDRTRHRSDTFYGDGIVVHVSFGDPFSADLAQVCGEALEKVGVNYHKNETLICMEGPAFSTRAESKLYKSWGAGIINMSVLPEAKLARELEICYQMICMSTDYDSWREESAAVDAEEIMQVVKTNSEVANKVVAELIPAFAQPRKNDLLGTVKFSTMTAPDKRPAVTREKLNQVLPGYF